MNVQKINVNNQENEIEHPIELIDVDGDDSFLITDENSNTVVKFDGGIKTKNFNSDDVPLIDNIETLYDFSISDENQNIICAFYNGHIITKNFDSANIQIPDSSGGSVVVNSSNSEIVPIKRLGCLGVQHFKPCLNIIATYGQSLSIGTSASAKTTTPVQNTYMLGSNPRDINSTTLNPLKAVGTEDFVVSMCQAMETLFINDNISNYEIIGTASGVGGSTIEQQTNTYYDRFVSHITHCKTAAQNENKDVVCPVIVYCQGETDYEQYTAKDTYKERLVALKNKMQATCREILGQTFNPLFMVTMPGGRWASRPGRHTGKFQSLFIHQAEYEACCENDDMILVGSSYFTPEFSGRHLASNGYRWLGEYCAKLLYTTIDSKVFHEAICATDAAITTDGIMISTNSSSPLIIDNNLITKKESSGFTIRVNNTNLLEITNVLPIGNSVLLKTGKLLTQVSSVDLFDTLNNNVITEYGTISGTDTKFATIGSMQNIGNNTYFQLTLTSGYFAKVFYYSSNNNYSSFIESTQWVEDGQVLKSKGDYIMITMKKGERGLDVVPLTGQNISYDGTEIVLTKFSASDIDLSNLSNAVVTYCLDTGGEGNIRNSDSWSGNLLYLDDTNEISTFPQDEAHISHIPNIIGQKYPCYDWLCPFTISL